MKSETGHAGTRKASLSVGAAALACVGVAWWYYASAGPRHSTPNPLADMPGSYCEEGISAARAKAGLNSGEARATAGAPLRLTPTTPPGPTPAGMVWIPGGEFWMGADDFPDSRPWHRVRIDEFWMDTIVS